MQTRADRFPIRNTHSVDTDSQIWNWAQNDRLGARDQVQRPGDEDQLRALVAGHTGNIAIMGSRLSTGELMRADHSGTMLLDPGALAGRLNATPDTVTFGGATPLHLVYSTLTEMGRMLASSPGVIALQTLAGAIATGTHGQGLRQSAIADEVLHLRLILADGGVLELDRQHPWFGAAQLALGTLGVVAAVTLKTIPMGVFTCFKSATDDAALESTLIEWNETFPLSKAWWFPEDHLVHVWRAREATADETDAYRLNNGETVSLSSGDDSMNTTVDRTLAHMQNDIQGAKGDKPFKTVERFKDFSDITGDIYQLYCRGIATPQINIEIGIPLRRAGQVIQKIKQWYSATHPHMHYPVILRCTGASGAWLSPASQEATCFFGFVVYYAADGTLSKDGVRFLNAVEKLLAREGGRPHWGKYYDPELYRWHDLYPQWQRFRAARAALDPTGKFANAFTTALFG